MLRGTIAVLIALFTVGAAAAPFPQTIRPGVTSEIHIVPGIRPSYREPYRPPQRVERPPEEKPTDLGRIYEEDKTGQNRSARDTGGLDVAPPTEVEVEKKENDQTHGNNDCNDKSSQSRCKDR